MSRCVNRGKTPDALIAATADVAERVEVHETRNMSGMMMMEKVAKVELAPGSRVELKPGSYHLMLIGLKRSLTPGQTVNLTLGSSGRAGSRLAPTSGDGAGGGRRAPGRSRDRAGGAAWAAFAPLPATGAALTFVIPPGTAARLKAGEPFTVLPSPIYLTVGVRDVLVITNDDEVIHQVGPIILGSRQTYRIPFRKPGHFQYACSLHADGHAHLVIAPPPAAGLERLRWRLDQLIARS